MTVGGWVGWLWGAVCDCIGKVRLSLRRPKISLIQAWPTRPWPQKFIIQEEVAGRQSREHVLVQSDWAALPPRALPKTNWLGSAARQLADEEVRCIRPTCAFSSWRLLLFFFLLLQHVTCCSVSLCPSLSHALSLTHTHNTHTH